MAGSGIFRKFSELSKISLYLLWLGARVTPLLVAAKRCVQHIFRTYAESFSPTFSESNLLKLLPENFA